MACPDLVVSDDRCGDVALPVNPYVSNRYHFGMLLGVADLEAEQAYHRGKMWLHNAWLHGIGAVWGLRVEVEADRNELVVHAGLAIDAHGRELRVTDTMCVDLGRWFAERRPDDLEVTERDDGGASFTVHVELCHDSCLDRPVPSIAEPCGDASLDTAYSRAVERGLPRIVPGPAPDEPPPWYPRLRQFFGQAPATDPDVVIALSEVDAAAAGDRPRVCLQWFRWLAAEDTMDLAPEEGAAWSPVAGDGCVPLAQVEVHLDADGDVVVDGPDATVVDNRVRPSHVRTRTIQELLCGHHGAAGAPAPPPPPDDGGGAGEADLPPDADVPTEGAATEGAAPQAVDAAAISGRTITIPLTRPLDPATVATDAVSVTVLRADGWTDAEVSRASVSDDGRTLELRLSGAPRSRPIRIVAHGAGPRPLLGVDGRPLSGLSGSAVVPGGVDAALMITDTDTPDEE